jgi:hypothetical protein
MFFVLGRVTWTEILTHQGAWQPTDSVVWCVWTAFASLAGLGIVHPLKMLPILLLSIVGEDALQGSSAESIASPFAWVILPIVAIPWRYVFTTYVWTTVRRMPATGH